MAPTRPLRPAVRVDCHRDPPRHESTSLSSSAPPCHVCRWLPILPDGPLGDFMQDLGPGQVVGRQVLASPVLGEIQLGIAVKRGNLEVEIIRARNLLAKSGAKSIPGAVRVD